MKVECEEKDKKIRELTFRLEIRSKHNKNGGIGGKDLSEFPLMS